jgi:hypothetical protein
MSTKCDKATAVCCDYSGIAISRIEAFDSSSPVFFVQVKRLDFEAITAEMKDENQPVYLPAILASMKKVDGLLELAKPSGVWQKKREP